MQDTEFYPYVMEAMTFPPEARHDRLLQLHARTLDDYRDVVHAFTADQVAQVVPDDGRTLAQIVGHMAGWERFAVLAAGDILAGIEVPRMMRHLEGYLDVEGKSVAFRSVDEFNAYQAEQWGKLSWPQVRAQAVDVASTFYELLVHPSLLNAERLERTRPTPKRFANGERIEETTMGWSLWLIVLEHQAVDHAAALGLA